ncbi:MAG: signal peptidase I [Chloroflexi bacterium]|nr:signal peptidase I [Chloroflexota bacterium]
MKSTVRDMLWTVLFAVIAFLLLRISIQTFRVDQPSMQPNVQPGWWVVVNKVSYRIGDPKPGDVIIFNAPIDMERDFIKRVIAGPGQTVEVKGTRVYVDGKAVDEPYIKNIAHYSMPPTVVPPGDYFVLGDNRDLSVDSHYGWYVPRDSIVGKAWLVIWPPSNWGLAPNYDLIASNVEPAPLAVLPGTSLP